MNLENKNENICSKCGSINIKQNRIKENSSNISIVISSIFSFITPLITLIYDLIKSIFSLDNKEDYFFQCNDCGYKW